MRLDVSSVLAGPARAAASRRLVRLAEGVAQRAAAADRLAELLGELAEQVLLARSPRVRAIWWRRTSGKVKCWNRAHDVGERLVEGERRRGCWAR